MNNPNFLSGIALFTLLAAFCSSPDILGQEKDAAGQADASAAQRLLAASGPGWKSLTGEDFTRVNSAEDTWTFKGNMIHCTGKPVSVIRSKKTVHQF